MSRVYEFCVHRPRLVIGLGVLVALAVSPGLLRLRLRTDGNALVPAHAPEIETDQEIREAFGLEDPIVVVVRSDDPAGIFNPHTPVLIEDLTTAFRALPGVNPDNVFSLSTEFGDRVFPGTLRFRRLLEPMPRLPNELEQLRTDLRLYGLYTGLLMSKDERSAAILVGAAQGVDRVDLVRRIRETLASRDTSGDTVSVIGAPVAEALLGTHILQDLGVPNRLLRIGGDVAWDLGAMPRNLHDVRTWVARKIGLVPLALFVMSMIFLVYFGSVAAVLLPLMEVGACLIVVFAAMGWMGVPIYLTIAVMPIILTAAGVTDEIHVFARYRERLHEAGAGDHRGVLLATMKEIGRPVLMTCITTAAGFLAFAFSPIAPVRAFGVFTALGIVFCTAWSLTVIPASLSLVHPAKVMGWNSKRGGHKGLAADQFARLACWVIRYRLVVLPGAVLLGAISIFGIQRVVVQDSWIDGFAEESEFRRATDAFNEQFHGGHTLLVAVDAGRERFAGRITGADFDGLWIKLPLDSVAPESVMDWRLRLTRTDPPIKPEGSPTRREAVLNSWTTWITEALREGAFLRVKGIPTHGMAKLTLRLSDSDGAWFELVPARLSRPETMGAISALETFLESQWALAVGGVVGTADYVETVNFLRRGRKVGTRSIPLMAEEVEWVWREYAQMRGEKRIRQLINADSSRSVITVFLNNANFVDTAELMRRIRAYEKEHLAPTGVSLAFAGDVAVSQALIGAIVGTQVISVAAALAGDLVVTVLLGRSLAFGALCVIPSLLAVLLNFAVMGWWGIPLGVATSMFSSMTLGMGVDYAIHFLQCYRQQRTQGTNFGADPAGIGESVTGRPLGTADPPAVTEENAPNHDAVVAAARITGPAIFGNTLAVTLGFGVLMLSQVPANARLGALLVLSLFNCFGATMLILPAIVAGNPSRKSENREPAKVLCG